MSTTETEGNLNDCSMLFAATSLNSLCEVDNILDRSENVIRALYLLSYIPNFKYSNNFNDTISRKCERSSSLYKTSFSYDNTSFNQHSNLNVPELIFNSERNSITPEKMSTHMPPYLYRLLKDSNFENSGNHESNFIRRKRTLSSRSVSLEDKENIPGTMGQFSSHFLDGDSQDSGFFSMHPGKKKSSGTTEYLGCPPRKLKAQDGESSVENLCHSVSSMSRENSYFSSSSLSTSIPEHNYEEDDGFLDMLETEHFDEESQMPVQLKSLMTEKLKENNSLSPMEITVKSSSTEMKKHPGIRRCLSLAYDSNHRCQENAFTGSPCLLPKNYRNATAEVVSNCTQVDSSTTAGSSGTFQLQNNVISKTKELKTQCNFRSHSSDVSHYKQRKNVTFLANPGTLSQDGSPHGNTLKRCLSESEATIMRAVQKSSQDPNLIGDFSKPYSLPLIEGKHQDIKTVTSQTVTELLKGNYSNIDNFVIVDCRYPYEYHGGHILGAKNIYTKEGILQEFLGESSQQRNKNKCNIVIFHCEFSSERAPKLYRFLRNKDREANNDCYPALYHPEMYILHGGYKAFYESFKEYCEPQGYMPMLHKDHERDLRHFRSKSKSWSGDSRTKLCVRPGLNF